MQSSEPEASSSTSEDGHTSPTSSVPPPAEGPPVGLQVHRKSLHPSEPSNRRG